MRAALMTDYRRDLVIDEIADARIESVQDVVVRVAATGVCGSDLHLRSGALEEALGRARFPYILGHESVGTVEEVGSGVTSVVPGDIVALHPLITCGVCSGCRSGRDMYCASPQFPGVDGVTQGGWAELLRTGARSCVKLPAALDPLDFVAATDAGLTGYHAVKRALPWLAPGQTVVVIGAGGVGQFVLQSLIALSSVRVVVTDLLDARLVTASELGAHDVRLIDAAEDPEPWRGMTGEIDVVFDCVSTTASSNLALSLLRRGGVLSVIGGSVEPMSVTSARATSQELTILGNYVGHHQDLLELVSLVEAGTIRSTHREFPLDNAEEALQELAAGRLDGRAVLIP